ncbi:hypothetical protein O6H91_09G100200 [Diphasiastrum complanatum]|uniref:Uncharacterized protein n=1 Tax=Diphasiastrum complanatum TaxID=34168 RepID=A0ACC2CSH1_DIPCM|nr:hypothetical protein O6H91_09G100200 [Diphasiastrum complanatum]
MSAHRLVAATPAVTGRSNLLQKVSWNSRINRSPLSVLTIVGMMIKLLLQHWQYSSITKASSLLHTLSTHKSIILIFSHISAIHVNIMTHKTLFFYLKNS